MDFLPIAKRGCPYEKCQEQVDFQWFAYRVSFYPQFSSFSQSDIWLEKLKQNQEIHDIHMALWNNKAYVKLFSSVIWQVSDLQPPIILFKMWKLLCV